MLHLKLSGLGHPISIEHHGQKSTQVLLGSDWKGKFMATTAIPVYIRLAQNHVVTELIALFPQPWHDAPLKRWSAYTYKHTYFGNLHPSMGIYC